MATFASLVPDVQHVICQFLPLSTLATIESVSRQWQQVVLGYIGQVRTLVLPQCTQSSSLLCYLGKRATGLQELDITSLSGSTEDFLLPLLTGVVSPVAAHGS
jgi:hypothetical protein